MLTPSRTAVGAAETPGGRGPSGGVAVSAVRINILNRFKCLNDSDQTFGVKRRSVICLFKGN